jgi:hypothetical protein
VGCEVQNSCPPYLFTAAVRRISCLFNETPAPDIFAAVSLPQMKMTVIIIIGACVDLLAGAFNRPRRRLIVSLWEMLSL